MKLFPGSDKSKDLEPSKVSYQDPGSTEWLSARLTEMISDVPSYRSLVIVCIGTDRSTGDCLGPMVGTKLSKSALDRVTVYGTLDEPVHAMNLSETMAQIDRKHDSPFIVAIDACLGQLSSVGCIQIANGPVKPGAGVNKDLPPVWDMHITGIVNVGGFMEYFVLQNTRLSLVMNMAEIIADGLKKSLTTQGKRQSIGSFRKID